SAETQSSERIRRRAAQRLTWRSNGRTNNIERHLLLVRPFGRQVVWPASQAGRVECFCHGVTLVFPLCPLCPLWFKFLTCRSERVSSKKSSQWRSIRCAR